MPANRNKCPYLKLSADGPEKIIKNDWRLLGTIVYIYI